MTTFVVDSGAERTLISHKCLSTLPEVTRQKFTKESRVMCLADGTHVKTLGPVECMFRIGERSIEGPVFVTELTDDALLGWDIQLKIGVQYTVAGIDIVKDVTLPNVRAMTDFAVCRVLAIEAGNIPAQSEIVFRGRIDGGAIEQDDALVGPLEGGGGNDIIVGRAVVDARDGECWVRAMNPSDEIVTFERDQPVAVIEGVKVSKFKSARDDENDLGLENEVPEHLQGLYKEAVEMAKLDNRVASELRKVLRKHQNVFAKNDDDLGKTSMVCHDIDTGDALPIRQPPRRVPLAQQAECEKEINEMLRKGVIEPGQSPWAAPVVLVRKKDGSVRFCVDYRRLNSVTRFDAYPLPRIDETLDALAGAKWFSTLDLISGYWQVGLTPEARLKSAFCTRGGLFLWNVMPFGLCNAPSTFERLMETVLRGLHWSTCLVYLDDVVIYGRTEDELIQRMDEIFSRLQSAGLKLKPRKCHLFAKETEYLGHIISGEGIRVNPVKIAAIKDWPVPKCTTELRSFLGTAGYYRKYVAGFATIASPLHELTGGEEKFDWTSQRQEAFEALKAALCGAPVLNFPVHGATFILDTDASDCGIGAVLSQLIPAGCDEKGEPLYDEKVIGYASRTLNVHEKKYCTTRKELLSVVWFIRHFRPYLYGQEFLVRTDHASLQWLCSFWEPEGQIARWLQILGEYSFKVIHRAGKRHHNADGLSRRGPCKQCSRDMEETPEQTTGFLCPPRINQIEYESIESIRVVGLIPEWTPNQIAVWQKADKYLSPVLSSLLEAKLPSEDELSRFPPITKRYFAEWERLKLIGGVAYRIWFNNQGIEAGTQLLVPDVMKPSILQVAHDGETAGHYGDIKTANNIRKHFFWSSLSSDTRHYCRTCLVCQRRKAPPTRPHHPLQQPMVSEPLQRVTLDILGFERATPAGNRYVLVVVDTLTKWAEAYAMQDEKSETVARLLVEEFVCRWGIPRQLHSDQGRQFESAVFQEMCRLLGMRKTRTTALHPQSDGQTERLNRTLLDLLAKLAVDEPQKWDEKLAFAMMAYRSTPHSTTGETPNRLMLGREAATPLQLLAPVPADAVERTAWTDKLHQNFEQTHQLVLSHYGKEQRLQKQNFDCRQKGLEFKEKDLVWFLEPRPRKGIPYKLNANRWSGPYAVKKRLSPAVYVIDFPGTRRNRVISTARLRPYVERRNDLQPITPIVEEETIKDEDPDLMEESTDASNHHRDDVVEEGDWPTPPRICTRSGRTVRPPPPPTIIAIMYWERHWDRKCLQKIGVIQARINATVRRRGTTHCLSTALDQLHGCSTNSLNILHCLYC